MNDRIRVLERELLLLKRYALAVSCLMVAALLMAFRDGGHQRLTVLDVERLNIIEPDGTVRLAIANPDRLPPATFKGKEYPGIRGGIAPGIAGMIYFNNEGTEMGGFGWSGRETEAGTPRAVGLLTFDHFNQNEAMSLSYSDIEGQRRAGLTIYDQPHVSIQPFADSMFEAMRLPEGPERERRLQELQQARIDRGEVGVTRLYVGRDVAKAATVLLSDAAGRPRLRMSVDSLGTPRLEFLDEQGGVTLRLPEGG